MPPPQLFYGVEGSLGVPPSGMSLVVGALLAPPKMGGLLGRAFSVTGSF